MCFGYLSLHPSFLLVGDWLGPILGSSIYTLLTVVFLLFGDPLSFVALAVVWGLVAFIGGVIIRRRLGATLMMLLLFLSLIPVLVVSSFGMYQKLQEAGLMNPGSNPLEMLPAIPRGFTLANILEAPIIGKIARTLMDMMINAQQGNSGDIFGSILQPLIIDFALKPVIIVVAALIGVEVGRRLEKPLAPRSESMRLRLGGKPLQSPATPVTAMVKLKSGLLLCMLLFSGLSYGIQSTKSVGNGTYLENLGGVVDMNGRAYIGDLFIDSGTSLPGLGTGSQGSQGLIVSLLISHDGMVDMLSKSGVLPEEVDVGSFTNLLPPTFAVMVYAGVPKPDAESRANIVSSAFSGAYGVSLQKIAAFGMTQSLTDTAQVPFTVILYQSPSTFSDVAGIYLDQYVRHGGFAELVDEASRNRQLIPHANPDSADGSLIFTGMVNITPLSEFLPFGEIPENYTDIVAPLLEGPVGVSGGFSYFNHGYTKVGGKDMLDLLSLLGAEETPSFSPDATSSLMILMAPNSTYTGGPDEGANVKITTTLPLGQAEYDLIYGILSMFGQVHLGKPGEQLGGQSFQVEIEGVALPLNVRVTKNVSPETTSPNGVVQVTVTVKNDDSKAMMDVLVDDGTTISGYPTSASVVSGSTSMTVGSVAPGESKSFTYGVRLGEAGAYTLKPASLTYSYAGKVFEDNSNQPEAMVERPNALFLAIGIAVNTWSLAADGLSALMGSGGRMVIIGLTLLILGYVAFNWFRSFRRWLSGPSPPPASPS
jgi:hypothetical protein